MSNVIITRKYSIYMTFRRHGLVLLSSSTSKLSSSIIVEKVNKLLVCPQIIIR